jgi:hypothetical protein
LCVVVSSLLPLSLSLSFNQVKGYNMPTITILTLSFVLSSYICCSFSTATLLIQRRQGL